MKTAFLIIGFRLNTTAADPPYHGLHKLLSAKGYHVVPVPIMWNRQTISSFVEAFVPFYRWQKGDYNLVMGGSFGAMATFVAAPQIVPNEIVLCSLSGFFAEDLPNYDPAYLQRKFGHRRVSDFHQLSAAAIAQQINATPVKTTLLYGEKEKTLYPFLVARVKNTAAALTNARLIEAPGAGHKMRSPHYLKCLEKSL